MSRRTLRVLVLSVVVAVGATAAIATASKRSAAARPKPVPFEAHDLYIETNATDGDAGLQLFADAEDWRTFQLRDPHGKVLVDIRAKGASTVSG
jgi:hypothetical protein